MDKVKYNSVEEIITQIKKFTVDETVIGKPHKTGETTIIPINAIRLGVGASSSQKIKPNKSVDAGGGGAIITPIGFIIIKDGVVSMKTFQASNLDTFLAKLPKIIDKVVTILVRLPKIIDKIMKAMPTKEPSNTKSNNEKK